MLRIDLRRQSLNPPVVLQPDFDYAKNEIEPAFNELLSRGLDHNARLVAEGFYVADLDYAAHDKIRGG
jgi:hypothetical protein